jgi:MSHA biogenesis protein MshP
MHKQGAQGFVLPAAIFLLVVLGGLAGWMMQLTQATHAQDALAIESARAYQAAQAGLEVGIYAARQSGASCTDVEQDFALAGQLARFTVSINCSSTSENEAGNPIVFFQINSIACNQPVSGACPNPTPTLPEYAERHMRATVESGL